MRDRVAFAAAALALAFVAGLHVGRVEAEQPPCPSEDSCRADYRDGAWHIIPLSPEDI